MQIELTHARASAVVIFLLLSFTGTFAQNSPECCSISGYVFDNSSNPLSGIPITIKRGAEVLRGGNKTDGNGHYSISYSKGRTLDAVSYGNTKWGPSVVINISGSTSHIINKVLVSTEQAKYSVDEATDIVVALDFFRLNASLYSEEIVQFSGVIKKDSLPKELRPKLHDFEEVAAVLKKNLQRDFRPVQVVASADPVRKYAKALDDMAGAINAMIKAKRELARNGRISHDEELKLTNQLLAVNTAVSTAITTIKSSTTIDASNKPQLSQLFTAITSAMNDLNSSIPSLNDPDAKNKLSKIFAGVTAALNIISALQSQS